MSPTLNRGWVTLGPNLGVFPLEQTRHVGVAKSEHPRLTNGEIILEEFQPMWSQSTNTNVTDRRTDRRHAIAIPSDGKVLHRASTCYAAVNRRLTELWSQYAADQQLLDVTVPARCRAFATARRMDELLKRKRLHALDWLYSVSQKNPPLRFSEVFSQTVGNF